MNELNRRLWNQISAKRRKQLVVVTFLMIVTSLAEVVSVGAVLPFLGVLMEPEALLENAQVKEIMGLFEIRKPGDLILALTVGFVVAIITSGFMKILLFWYQTRVAFGIGADFSRQIYEKTLYQPYSVHISRNTSHLVSAISTKTNIVIYSVLLPILIIASSITILTIMLIALITLNVMAAIVIIFGFGGIYGLILIFTKSRLEDDGKKINYESTRVIKALQEGLGGIREVLIDGSQAAYYSIYSRADLRLRRAQANIQIIGGLPRYLIECLGMVFIALIAYKLSLGDGGISDDIPTLGAIAIGAQRLLPVLQQLYLNLSYIRGAQATQRDVIELLEQPISEYTYGTKTKPLIFKRSIKLKNVDFSYENSKHKVLKGVCIEIPKGSKVGFIGATGSGKSTLTDIVMGLLYPTSGEVKIDDETLSKENQHCWRVHVGHVPQSIFLSDDTIAANIAFGVSANNIDMARVKAAASQAQLAPVIESWEKQYYTCVGERGVRLSGGQRQRIAIARAFYKRADVLVFDEATSALDKETEEAVIESIEVLNKNTTIIMIAHRLSTLRKCDRIYEVRNGSVNEIDKNTIL